MGIKENDNTNTDSFFEDIKRNTDDCYKIRLPFKPNHELLPDNYKICENRLIRKINELTKHPRLLKQYNNIFREQEEQGIIKKFGDLGELGKSHYLPHHQVVRADKQTTKVRVVFDASCESNGTSLNKCLSKRPQLIPLLFDTLLRFRQYQVGLITDR